MPTHRVFIASSSESLPIAYAIHHCLSDHRELLDPVVWKNDVRMTLTTIEALELLIADYEFAIFVFSPDDTAQIRGEAHAVTRDNVIFEFGLFLAKLGRSRCFIVAPEDVPMRMPTDFRDVTRSTYKNPSDYTDFDQCRQALRKSATEIEGAIRKHFTRMVPEAVRNHGGVSKDKVDWDGEEVEQVCNAETSIFVLNQVENLAGLSSAEVCEVKAFPVEIIDHAVKAGIKLRRARNEDYSLADNFPQIWELYRKSL